MLYLVSEYESVDGKIEVLMINDLTPNTGKYVINLDGKTIFGPSYAEPVIQWLCEQNNKK